MNIVPIVTAHGITMTARVPSLLSTASKARTTKIPVLQCLAQTSTSRQLSYLPNRRPANPAPLSTSHLCTRLASTSASPPPPAASAISSPQVPPQTTVSTHLTWNRFLQLRSIRRRYNLVSSILTAGATTFGGIVFLGQQDLDRLGNLLFGLDPIMAMGMGVVACGAAGWLIGPFAGNAAFGLWYRRLGPEIALVCTPLQPSAQATEAV